MIVMKFGGSVLGSPEGLRRMARILQERGPEPAIVVVSAMGSTTRDLERMATLSRDGSASKAMTAADALLAMHQTLVDQTIGDIAMRDGLRAMLQETRRELDALIEGIAITRQLTPRTLDSVMAIGEVLSLHIVRHVLADAGLDACSIDARRVLVTDGTYGNASPLPEQTALRAEHDLRPLLDRYPIVVIQGFVGRSEDGVTTTMGKESSNLTAVLLASVLNIHNVMIYTDVPGVRSCDPSICDATLPRPSMSYSQARLAAVHGVKVLYPTMIEPAERVGVSITIAGMQEHMTEVTRISACGGPCGPIVSGTIHLGSGILTCVFGAATAWLDAVRAVAEQCSIEQFDVTWSAADSVGTMTLPERILHQAMIIVHQRLTIHETRP